MNRLEIQQTGGFPLETDTLDFMQASYLFLQSFGEIAGNLSIISGCELNGVKVSDGIVYINGELLTFKGGSLGLNVVIQETRTQKTFEDGKARDVEIRRVAMFGNGLKSYPWNDFTRINPLKVMQKALVPKGLISMWSGSLNEIPTGWALCDGKNGTPNLSGKFIRGYSEDDYREDQNWTIGYQGGADKLKLKEVNMPPHSHNGTTNNGGEHKHSHEEIRPYTGVNIGGGFRGGNHNFKKTTEQTGLGGVHNHTFITNKAGGLNGAAVAFDNRPAFYTLAYIIKL